MKKLLFWVAICLPNLSWAEGERVDIARFSQGNLSGWQAKAFTGAPAIFWKTRMGRLALRADSSAAASGRYREVSVDLNKRLCSN